MTSINPKYDTSFSLEGQTLREEESNGSSSGLSGGGFYPVTLRVKDRRCVVVGGGVVAARKIGTLLSAGADVIVVAPRLEPSLAARKDEGAGFEWAERAFEPGDLQGAFLVVAATADAGVNRSVAEAAARFGCLVNVVDAPELSDFLVPSVLERGPLQIAVSTSGRSPALAAAVRRELEARFPAEWSAVAELVGELRARVLEAGLSEPERRGAGRELASLDFSGLLAQGGLAAVRRRLQEVAARYGLPVPPRESNSSREARPEGEKA